MSVKVYVMSMPSAIPLGRTLFHMAAIEGAEVVQWGPVPSTSHGLTVQSSLLYLVGHSAPLRYEAEIFINLRHVGLILDATPRA